MNARRPDFDVSFHYMGKWERVGAAWKNESETINIILNPFVVLPSMTEIKLTLYPKNYVPKARQKNETP